MTPTDDPFHELKDSLARGIGSQPPSGAAPTVEARPFDFVDLAAVADGGIPQPTLLFGRLLYRGMLHSLAGPPDCGKSTLAYSAALELARAGERVLVLDEEGGREVVVEKLLALGATSGDLDRIDYVEFPSRRWDKADRAGLWQLARERHYALAIADSAGALLGVAGQDENVAADVGPFYKLLLALAREHNLAVLVLDHVTKVDNGSRYARGSSMKLQIVDVALMLDAVKAFSRAQDGLLRLLVTKDRRGYLHRRHEITVKTGAGQLALELRVVDGGHDQDPTVARYAPAARKVLAAVRAATEPATSAQLGDWIASQHPPGLRRETISKHLNELCQDGLVTVGPAIAHGAKTWQAVPA